MCGFWSRLPKFQNFWDENSFNLLGIFHRAGPKNPIFYTNQNGLLKVKTFILFFNFFSSWNTPLKFWVSEPIGSRNNLALEPTEWLIRHWRTLLFLMSKASTDHFNEPNRSGTVFKEQMRNESFIKSIFSLLALWKKYYVLQFFFDLRAIFKYQILTIRKIIDMNISHNKVISTSIS